MARIELTGRIVADTALTGTRVRAIGMIGFQTLDQTAEGAVDVYLEIPDGALMDGAGAGMADAEGEYLLEGS